MVALPPTRDEIASAVHAVAGDGRCGVVAVYLFGSFARGTQKPGSDIDLGLLYDEA